MITRFQNVETPLLKRGQRGPLLADGEAGRRVLLRVLLQRRAEVERQLMFRAFERIRSKRSRLSLARP